MAASMDMKLNASADAERRYSRRAYAAVLKRYKCRRAAERRRGDEPFARRRRPRTWGAAAVAAVNKMAYRHRGVPATPRNASAWDVALRRLKDVWLWRYDHVEVWARCERACLRKMNAAEYDMKRAYMHGFVWSYAVDQQLAELHSRMYDREVKPRRRRKISDGLRAKLERRYAAEAAGDGGWEFVVRALWAKVRRASNYEGWENCVRRCYSTDASRGARRTYNRRR